MKFKTVEFGAHTAEGDMVEYLVCDADLDSTKLLTGQLSNQEYEEKIIAICHFQKWADHIRDTLNRAAVS